jgi:hypothetical protein
MATQQQLDDLKAAYYSGATSVGYEGKNISYRSAAEMRAAIMALEKELGIAPVTTAVIRSEKGW